MRQAVSAASPWFGSGWRSAVLPLVLALGVALSTAGSVNGSIMAGGSSLFAVARGGMAPSVLVTGYMHACMYVCAHV